jgi:hypothetical protein
MIGERLDFSGKVALVSGGCTALAGRLRSRLRNTAPKSTAPKLFPHSAHRANMGPLMRLRLPR